MLVFIYEYVCGGGLAGHPLPESLASEGWAMLASIVEDFAQVDGCDVVTALDDRFCDRMLAARNIERCVPGCERHLIERLAACADWTLLIAPEFDGVLRQRVQWAEDSGGRLLGPTSAAVALAADKLECGGLLERSGVPTVVGDVLCPTGVLPRKQGIRFPAVLKPRDGAGSQNTFLVPDAGSLGGILEAAARGGLTREALLQPYIPGRAASVSFLVGKGTVLPLLAGEQILSEDGRFRYLGGQLPLDGNLTPRAIALARRAVAAVPGLRGFVGVDLVLDTGLAGPHSPEDPWSRPASAETAGDVVIEINPRLTTSYVGLRVLCASNLAEHCVAACRGSPVPPIRWKGGTVCFQADGRLTWHETPTDQSRGTGSVPAGRPQIARSECSDPSCP